MFEDTTQSDLSGKGSEPMKRTGVYTKSILLVDEAESALTSYTKPLQEAGIGEVLTLRDSRQIIPLLATRPVSAIVLDLQTSQLFCSALLPKITRDFPKTPTILLSSADDIQTAVECMKMGASDFLVKPVQAEQLIASVRSSLEWQDQADSLPAQQLLLSCQRDYPEVFSKSVTASVAMRSIFQYVAIAARTAQPVLISGETGVGKELVARAIHELSGCKGELVALNVAGHDDNLFCDTLFGHIKGAFTGADQVRDGLICKASGGTLFLDEIGELSEASQVKLLRLIQEHEYYPVGSDTIHRSNARIVVATNRDLKGLLATGGFRTDLYYRLFAHRVHIPALRERPEDIPLLIEHFLEKAATILHKKKPTAPPELALLLAQHSFPGNIRELEGMVFDAVARHTAGILSLESFREAIDDNRPAPASPAHHNHISVNPLIDMFGHFPTFAEIEEFLTREALQRTNGNQGLAARLLGISRQTLNKRLRNAFGKETIALNPTKNPA